MLGRSLNNRVSSFSHGPAFDTGATKTTVFVFVLDPVDYQIGDWHALLPSEPT
jgi:hypothetical protein